MNDSVGLLEATAENAEMGKNTLHQMIPMAKDAELRDEMCRQQEGYQRLSQRIHAAMIDCDGHVRGQSDWAKMNARMGIAMKAMGDKRASKLAEMLVEGSNQGIMDCVKRRKEFPHASIEAMRLSEELETFQQRNIEALKRFL